MQNVTTQLSELTITIDALSTQNPSSQFKGVDLLLEVEDRESLKNDLEQSMSAFKNTWIGFPQKRTSSEKNTIA